MGGLHFRLGYKSVQVHTKEIYYGEPLMGRIFHRQVDKHLSCAALGLCGCEQNPGDPQGFCWVRTKLDLTLVVSRFQTLSNRLNRSSLSTQPPTGQAVILFIINWDNNLELCNIVGAFTKVTLLDILLFLNSDMNIEIPLCSQQAKQLWEQKWKQERDLFLPFLLCGNTGQWVRPFLCFDVSAAIVWIIIEVGQRDGSQETHSGVPLTLHFCTSVSTSYIISHHDENRLKQCGNRTAVGMKDINNGANLMKRWLNIGDGFSCVLCCVVTLRNTRNEYGSYLH